MYYWCIWCPFLRTPQNRTKEFPFIPVLAFPPGIRQSSHSPFTSLSHTYFSTLASHFTGVYLLVPTPFTTLLVYTLLVISFSAILSKCLNHLRVLHLMHSSTPHFIPNPMTYKQFNKTANQLHTQWLDTHRLKLIDLILELWSEVLILLGQVLWVGVLSIRPRTRGRLGCCTSEGER